MKLFFAAAGLTLASFNASATTTTYGCKSEHQTDYSLVFTVEYNAIRKFKTPYQKGKNLQPKEYYSDGTVEYEFLVDDSNDTKTWFILTFRDGDMTSVKEWESGNDSDNYVGYPTETAITCDPIK